jgi:tetratricopeptide (TPR) repeat protein
MDSASFNEAELFYLKGLNGYKITFGDCHPTVAEAQYYLGLLYMKINQLDTALERFHNSESLYEIIFNKEHPHVARAKESLGDVYSICGNINLAKRYFKDALEIYTKNLGNDHPILKLLKGKLNKINDL